MLRVLSWGVKNKNFSVSVSGQKGVVIGIIPRQKANPLSVSNVVQNELKDIQKHLPEGVKVQLLYDSSIFC